VRYDENRIGRRLKAIVGIESAIVLIAFVVVAAALAFVVLNMGILHNTEIKRNNRLRISPSK